MPSTFTAEEEKKIQEAVQSQQEKERQIAIEEEARRRALAAQSEQPGYRYG